MHVIFFIFIIIGYICVFFISIYTVIYIFRHQQNYGIRYTAVLYFLTIFNAVVIYSTLYLFSIIIFFSENINLIFWKLSIIFGIIELLLISLIYTFLKEYKKIPYFPFTFFTILFGILIGSLFSPNSIQIFIESPNSHPFFLVGSSINYTFNIITGIIGIILQGSMMIYWFALSFITFSKPRSEEKVKNLISNTIFFSLPILMYILYITLQLSIFRELHIILLWINIIGVCLLLVKKPELFLELTKKIYYLNIYHKSGILLYSYKFKSTTNEIDSAIWGNILIGINHILSEFIDTKDQIEVLQTENSDIIVNYDEFGFAVVLMTNHKNAILKNLMEKFTEDFKNKYKSELTEIQDLNKLINVSEFKETKNIVEKIFQMYL